MNCLKILLGSLALSFFALYNGELSAQESELTATYEVATAAGAAEVTFESNPVVQELPDYSTNWLDGRVNLKGGEYTTSLRQYQFAEANGIPVVRNRGHLNELIASGHLARLEGPYIRLKPAKKKKNAVIPYVLPELRDITVQLSEVSHEAGCGYITVNSALRLANSRPLWNSSPYSVHPRGMAVDVRTNEGLIGERCAEVIWQYAENQESLMIADATEETCTKQKPCPHLHLVIVPEPRRATEDNDLVARYPAPQKTIDQSE